MQYVYRYLDGQRTVYVGITNNMKRRFSEHKTDKLGNIHDCKVEFFSVKNRADAELLETYLINKFKTGDFYNVAKANRGDVSFLDGVEFPWTECADGVRPTLFNAQSPVTVVEEKVVYKDGADSLTSTLNRLQKGMLNEGKIIRNIREVEIPTCMNNIANADAGIANIPEDLESMRSEYNDAELKKIAEESESLLLKARKMWEERIELLRKYADKLECSHNFITNRNAKRDREDAHCIGILIERQVAEINEFHKKYFGLRNDLLTTISADDLP